MSPDSCGKPAQAFAYGGGGGGSRKIRPNQPVVIRAQVFAGDLVICGLFDSGAEIGRDWTDALFPLPNLSGAFRERSGQGRLVSINGEVFDECHSPKYIAELHLLSIAWLYFPCIASSHG